MSVEVFSCPECGRDCCAHLAPRDHEPIAEKRTAEMEWRAAHDLPVLLSAREARWLVAALRTLPFARAEAAAMRAALVEAVDAIERLAPAEGDCKCSGDFRCVAHRGLDIARAALATPGAPDDAE